MSWVRKVKGKMLTVFFTVRFSSVLCDVFFPTEDHAEEKEVLWSLGMLRDVLLQIFLC